MLYSLRAVRSDRDGCVERRHGTPAAGCVRTLRSLMLDLLCGTIPAFSERGR